MDAQILQDRIGKGMGVAARRAGLPVQVYRPQGPADPLCRNNEVYRLSALFLPGTSGTAIGYGPPLWRGIFDTAYTQAGDYLLGVDAAYFIASQRPGLPAQCVLTNRTISVVRPMPALVGGYSGFFATPGAAILTGWPASLLESSGHANIGTVEQTRLGGWTILLPVAAGAAQAGDVVSDDLGSAYAVGSVEQNALGWRLLVRQVSA